MTNKEVIYLLKQMAKEGEYYGRISIIGRHGVIEKAIETLEKVEHAYTQIIRKIDDIIDGADISYEEYKRIIEQIYDVFGLDWSDKE